MNNDVIALKPVNDLLDMDFYIPDYQRGYRWTELMDENQLLAAIQNLNHIQQQEPYVSAVLFLCPFCNAPFLGYELWYYIYTTYPYYTLFLEKYFLEKRRKEHEKL